MVGDISGTHARFAIVDRDGLRSRLRDCLGPSDVRCIGSDIPGIPDAPVTILGAGTGFGVSIPTRLIVNSNAALLGAARALEEIHFN